MAAAGGGVVPAGTKADVPFSWEAWAKQPGVTALDQGSIMSSLFKNYGGAKFFLAKASFVPMRGLLVEANYGFNAKDMGGKKMDNMFMLKATAYIK